ncbi:MAG TPA: hypothetical protein VKF79_10265 [Candidatus Acidoferrum sp.]|nr:hypothetical protein [Candidatus Acidoferrum sp.]
MRTLLNYLRAPAAAGGMRRNPLFILGFLVVFVYSARTLANYVINDDMNGLAYLGLILIIGASVVVILNNWRNGAYFFLTWLLFEDFARKFLGNNMAIYFAKDFLLLVVYISFIAAYRKKEFALFRVPFRAALLLFVWLGIMQVFNPQSTTVWYGLMGFKIFFYYVPLLFVGYAFFNSERDIRRFFTINVALILLIVSLGIAQSILGAGFLNPAHQAEDLKLLSGLYRVSPITGQIAYRPTSVFVSAGRYADFTLIAWLLVLGFCGYLLLRQKKGRNIVFLAIAVTAAGAFLTASRGALLWTIINGTATLVAFVWGAPWREGEALRAFRVMQRAIIGVALGIVLLFLTFPDALLSRVAIYKETLDPNSTASELGHRTWTYPVENFLGAFYYTHWLTGYGIGTTALGGQYVARFFNAKPPVVGVESGFGTLVVEMGILGLVLWLTMTAAILFAAWGVIKKLRGSPLFPIGFVIFWYALVLLLPLTFAGIQPYEDFLLNAYFWLTLGILFRLPTIKLATLPAGNAANLASRRFGFR